MSLALTPDNLVALIGVIGPLLVGALTGLKTSSTIKTWLTVAIISFFTAVQIIANQQFGADLVKNIVLTVTVWGGFYQLFKGMGLTTWLQANVPVYVGQAKGAVDGVDTVLDAVDAVFTPVPVTKGVPEQTNNGVKDFDGEQDVCQSPDADYSLESVE